MKTTQLHTYKYNYKLREHQKDMLNILKNKINKNFNGIILDIGCAQGVFLKHFKKYFKKSKLEGIDTSSELINRCKKLKILDSKFYSKDFLNLKKKYEIVIAAGILGYYDDFKKPLKKMISLTKKRGTLIVFSHLNSFNIDTIVRFRNNTNCNKWERGLNSYSIITIKKFLKKMKVKFYFKQFNIPIRLKPKKNPIISYTIDTLKKKKIILSGSNLRLEYFYLIIKK